MYSDAERKRLIAEYRDIIGTKFWSLLIATLEKRRREASRKLEKVSSLDDLKQIQGKIQALDELYLAEKGILNTLKLDNGESRPTQED